MSSTGSGSGAASDSTISSLATTSIAPVASSGFSLPSGRAADRADDLDAELVAQRVRVLLAEDHLHHAGGVPEIDEDDPAVVAAAGHPPGERHRRAGVARAQTAGVMGTDHGNVSSQMSRGAPDILSGAPRATAVSP